MNGIVVKNNQSVFDVSIEHLGSAESAVELAFANDISITDPLAVGTELTSIAVADKKTAELYRNFYNKPATAISEEEEMELIDDDEPQPVREGPFDYTYDDTFDN